MTDEELFDQVAALLQGRGYSPLTDDNGRYWEFGRSRVRLHAPGASSPALPYVIGRQRYDMIASGDRVLLPQSNPLMVEAGASPERLADLVEDQLKSPF